VTDPLAPAPTPGDVLEYPLTGYGDTGRTATVVVVRRSRPERTRSALRGLAGAWAAAIASLFIPVAHFVLVPAFFAFGIYRFATRLNADVVALAARGTCPDCGAVQELDVTGRWRVPRFTTCRHCQRSLRIGP
jgi:hypothetical protein